MSKTKVRRMNGFIKYQLKGDETNGISDGSHTFGELYHHRAVLFAVVCKDHPDVAWKSKQHKDGSMFPGYFVVGIHTPEGDYSYHYELSEWDMFKVPELPQAPKWDGHQPSDIGRLLSL